MLVEAKDSYDVMLLPGDGIGPEITAATVNAIEPLKSRFKINFKEVRCTWGVVRMSDAARKDRITQQGIVSLL